MSNETPPTEQVDLQSMTAAPHPEEMKGTVTFKLGNWASVTATGRATPAGLISAALLACAVLIPVLRVFRRR
jgi:hypothetical protein